MHCTLPVFLLELPSLPHIAHFFRLFVCRIPLVFLQFLRQVLLDFVRIPSVFVLASPDNAYLLRLLIDEN